jgi:hypothetical protein
VLQRAVVHENRARDHRSHNRSKESGSKERDMQNINRVATMMLRCASPNGLILRKTCQYHAYS